MPRLVLLNVDEEQVVEGLITPSGFWQEKVMPVPACETPTTFFGSPPPPVLFSPGAAKDIHYVQCTLRS